MTQRSWWSAVRAQGDALGRANKRSGAVRGRWLAAFAKARAAGAAALATLAVFFFLAGGLAAQALPQKLWSGMKWRLIGPFRGGRVLAVSGVPGNPNIYYFGAVAGGVWKSTDGGLSWTPIFDHEPVSSIGSIAVAPSDSNILYVGTGEACIRGNISFGDGVYKSVDGGQHWGHVGLDDTRHIGKVIVDPHDPNIVFVAALGHAYGANAERGVFRSSDGGKSWQKVLYKDEKTGAIDITFDPHNSHILYAALWQVVRTPWSLESGGPGSGLYKSIDGGTTWTELRGHGLPEGIWGRVGVAVGADSEHVYALIEAKEGGIYGSDDAGKTWQRVNSDHRFRQRAWYFTHIFADPANPETVYVLNTGLYRSTDGGKTFTLLPAPHGDHHGLWIDPADPRRMIDGNDGGATITTDGGKTWTKQDNQPTAQFYHVATDSRFNYYVYGAQQDNSTVAIASRTDHGAIGDKDWYAVGGGESGFVLPDPRDWHIVYADQYGGYITRFDKRTGQTQDISVWPVNPDGRGAAELKHRFQWTAPILISPFDPNVLYMGGERLFKTTDGGMSWTAVSPDLTRNDPAKQQSSGGPISKDNTGVEVYDTIFALAESPLARGEIWAGTDDGLVQLTRDDGRTWQNVTPKQMPEWTRIGLIEPSPFAAGTAYVAADRHKLDDYRPYIYKTTDYGKTWTEITRGLPAVGYVHAVREDPARRGLLFAGTETGIFVSFDDGARWQPLQLNLPETPVTDLVVKNDDLVISTKGRSFWILDDITPLRQASEVIAGEPAHLFAPRIAFRYRTGRPIAARFLRWYGQNAPHGAVIDYYLREAPKEEITLEILDSKGNVVRKFSSKKSKLAAYEQPKEWVGEARPVDLLPVEAGMNRFVWDLRYEPPDAVPGAVYDGGATPQGPLALPGKYEVRLAVGGKNYSAPLELRLDPRLTTSQADLEKQFGLALKVRDAVNRANDTVNQIRALQKQLAGLDERLAGNQRAKDALASAKAIEKSIGAIEDALIQKNAHSTEDTLNYPPQLNDLIHGVGGSIESADTAPTAQAYAAFDDLNQKLETQLAAWRAVLAKDLPALNQAMERDGIPAVSLPPSQAH
jgi:photosystem II stability/assembly factor-like uncharacterized protein